MPLLTLGKSEVGDDPGPMKSLGVATNFFM